MPKQAKKIPPRLNNLQLQATPTQHNNTITHTRQPLQPPTTTNPTKLQKSSPHPPNSLQATHNSTQKYHTTQHHQCQTPRPPTHTPKSNTTHTTMQTHQHQTHTTPSRTTQMQHHTQSPTQHTNPTLKHKPRSQHHRHQTSRHHQQHATRTNMFKQRQPNQHTSRTQPSTSQKHQPTTTQRRLQQPPPSRPQGRSHQTQPSLQQNHTQTQSSPSPNLHNQTRPKSPLLTHETPQHIKPLTLTNHTQRPSNNRNRQRLQTPPRTIQHNQTRNLRQPPRSLQSTKLPRNQKTTQISTLRRPQKQHHSRHKLKRIR